jgi:hypothetical protein
MHSRFLRTVILIAILVTEGRAFAKDKSLELRWNELSPIVVGHTISGKLPSGVTFRGEAIAVREDSLIVDVHRTSDSKALPSGQQSIPRTSLPQIDLTRPKGVGGRIIGTTLGILGGLTLSGAIIAGTDPGGGAASAIILLVPTATGALGYFAGKALDGRVKHIRIVP